MSLEVHRVKRTREQHSGLRRRTASFGQVDAGLDGRRDRVRRPRADRSHLRTRQASRHTVIIPASSRLRGDGAATPRRGPARKTIARETRSSSAPRSRRPLASTQVQLERGDATAASMAKAMYRNRCSPLRGRSLTSAAVAPMPTRSGPTRSVPADVSVAARARAARANAIAVSELHACSGAEPRNAASARSS